MSPNGLPIAATGLADDDARGVAERDRRERVVARVDAEHADVVEQVVADDPCAGTRSPSGNST